eukprot:786776_1
MCCCFLVFLGGLGFLIDALRAGEHFGIIVQFITLAVAGLGVTAMGLWLKKNQDRIRDPYVNWLRRVSGNENLAAQSLSIINNSNTQQSEDVFCCSDSQDVFSWIGAAIVNIAFIMIVSYSASQNFIAGFIACAIYSVILFMLARYFEKKPSNSSVGDEFVEGASIALATDATPNDAAPQTVVGLFYGLGILAIGATGFLFTLSIIGESECDDYYGECRSTWIRKQAIVNIFVTIIPMILVSLALWVKKSIPPCGFTTYFGIGLFGTALLAVIDPLLQNDSSATFYKWWYTLTSVAWILILSYLLVVPENGLSKAPLSWGLNTGALVFFVIMFVMVEIENDTALSWFLINVLSFIPLIFQGIVTEHNFLVFLGGLGFLIDALRAGEHFGIIVQFITLAVAGLGVTAMGLWLKKNQDRIRDPYVNWLKEHPLSLCEKRNTNGSVEGVESTPLSYNSIQ